MQGTASSLRAPRHWEEPGIELATFRLPANPLYLHIAPHALDNHDDNNNNNNSQGH